MQPMKLKSALWTGKKGQYHLKFYEREDGTVSVTATGPVPLDREFAWVTEVATATAKTRDEAHRLVVAKLVEMDVDLWSKCTGAMRAVAGDFSSGGLHPCCVHYKAGAQPGVDPMITTLFCCFCGKSASGPPLPQDPLPPSLPPGKHGPLASSHRPAVPEDLTR